MSALAAVVFLRSSSNIGMEVYHDKTKRPIVFGVGGVIVAMVTTCIVKFCSFYPIDWNKIWQTRITKTGDGGTWSGDTNVLGHRVL